MNFANLFSILGDGVNGTEDIVSQAWQSYINIVNIVMPVIISVVVSFGLVYGIIIGVQFAKAEETVIGVVVAAVFLAVVYVILGSSWIKDLIGKQSVKDPTGKTFLAWLR